MIFGLVVLGIHVPAFRVDALCPTTNGRIGLAHLILALWVNFGYCGTFGVLVAFFNIVVAGLGMATGQPGQVAQRASVQLTQH